MFDEQLQDLRHRQLLRRLRTLDSPTGPVVQVSGRPVVLLASNNYLGLATHPRVIAAAMAATQCYGVGAGASRLVSGNLTPHAALETALAQFQRCEAALTFSAGYLANLGVIPALIKTGGWILADRLCHASLIDACRLSGATLRVYRHGDTNHLEALLKRRDPRQPALVVTDGVFSMDGDIAPLAEMAALAERYDARLYVDDAHGTGVMGATGRGSLEHCGVEGRIPFHMGTLSKALGCAGGYVVGSHTVVQYLINTSRSFIYTTAPPPAVAAAAFAALQVLEQEPDRRTRLWENREYLLAGLRKLGFRIGDSVSPIMPILIGAAEPTLRCADELLRRGVYAPAIRPPTVPQGASRIRVTVTAEHTPAHLDEALAAFEHAGRTARII